MSRELCYYRLFVLTDIPTNRRDNVLKLKIRQWSPLAEYGHYSVWTASGNAQVWLWDSQLQRERFAEIGIKSATVIPETLLYPRPVADTVQLLQCQTGFEGQIWQAGVLTGSRWWAAVPNLNEWSQFLRAHSLAARLEVPTPVTMPLSEKPWGRPRTRLDKFDGQQESLVVLLGLAVFTVILTWQVVSLWQWHHATVTVQAQADELNAGISDILTARNQAIADKHVVEQLFALNPFPSQLELFTVVAENLPKDQAKLVDWLYQPGELQFTLEASMLDLTFYVKTFQQLPLFKDVKAESGREPKHIIMSMTLVK